MVKINKQREFLKFKIPFNKPHMTRRELTYIRKAHQLGWLSAQGFYSQKVDLWLEKNLHTKKALLTNSCTGALEIIGILSRVKSKDEVIMPSYTYVSTANAFVLRGAAPVFVDIREDTLNINENLIESAITKKTKGIMVVHYAGVGCEMDEINRIAKKHKLMVFEDAAQGLLAKYKGNYLGTLGQLGAVSFHETKNIISGEGGALLVNDSRFIDRAENIWEKGTNRAKFLKGQISEYSWVDIGSSYAPGEIVAAFLMAQLEQAKEITQKRIKLWEKYHKSLEILEKEDRIRRPIIPKECEHNAHIYYILLKNRTVKRQLMQFFKKRGILATSHYVPLHSSLGGKKFARFTGSMEVTNRVSNTLVRLPLFYDLTNSQQGFVIKSIYDFFKK